MHLPKELCGGLFHMFPACLLPLSLSFPTPNTQDKGNFADQSCMDRISISAELDT